MLRSRLFLPVLVLLAAGSLPSLRAQTYTQSVVYSFPAPTENVTGGPVYGGVIQAYDGNFYGTTQGDGAYGWGMVYRVTPAGSGSAVYSFCGQGGNCVDGKYPVASLVQGNDGNLYGTTNGGGTGTYPTGTLFKLSLGGDLTQIYSLVYCASDANTCPNGWDMPAAFIQTSDGTFYGITAFSQNYYSPNYPSDGTAFTLAPDGTFTTIWFFCPGGTCWPGDSPFGSLLEGSDGNLYGTLSESGAYEGGSVYKLPPGDPSNIEATDLYNFCSQTSCADGKTPMSGLVEGPDGNFYGTTSSGGAHDDGTVFKVTPGGTLTTLYSFCSQGGEQCTDGVQPEGGLLAATDGNFYGTTVYGGGNSTQSSGTVFKITPTGTLTTIYDFCSQTNCADGEAPYATLLQGSDGNLYGTTVGGGVGQPSSGVVYKIAISPALPAPVQLEISPASAIPGTPITFNWKALNAFSNTMKMCNAFVTTGGVTTALGRLQGSYSSSTRAYSGSVTLTAPAVGSYAYALTCGGQESAAATLAVVANSSATGVTATPSSPSVGQPATFTATVTAGSGTPTGTVTFSYGSDTLHTATVNNGVASFTASTNGLSPATYPITAKYSGDSNYAASASAISVALAAAPTTTALTVTPGSAIRPADVTLSATVTRSASGAVGVPTGSVTFYADGGDTLATVKLNSSGVAAVTASSGAYPVGTFAITAKYLGDKSDSVSTSSAVNVTLK